MANLNEFIKKPFKQESYLSEYSDSFLGMPASPEYSMGEMSLASLLRSIGSNVKEKEVYKINSLRGSVVRKSFEDRWNQFEKEFKISDDIFSHLKSPLAGKSPKNPTDYLNLYPIIPQFSYVSNSARFSGNPWNPSEFVKGMISTGSSSHEHSNGLWKMLFDCLTVTMSDDLWARILDKIFCDKNFQGTKYQWLLQEFTSKEEGGFPRFSLSTEAFLKYDFPARAFCESIKELVRLKSVTTRRQWISMFESFLRISMASHLLWICSVNIKLWEILKELLFLETKNAFTKDGLVDELFSNFSGFNIDTNSDNNFKNICGSYAEARIGINLVLHYFDENCKVRVRNNLGDMEGLCEWLNELQRHTSSHKDSIKEILIELLGRNPKVQQGEGSFTKNMFFFLKHSLGQKATNNPREQSFDQGYWVVKKGKARNAPWVIRFGPVAVITLVALSIKLKSGSATDITEFLSKFGIHINP
ncbi:hypothetical protein, partial [Flavihumibacter solisilvae]|uniref:hypothetical protein n=1 Tax=Flavihumibacter solisilvae TaxID=1349421 RepID=UPI00126A5B37